MTAFFSEFFCFHRKGLLLNLVLRNFKVKFRGSVLGYLWTLVIPLSQVLVFYFVYQVILKIQIPNYMAFILTGILPWVFFSTTVLECLESLVSGQNLLSQLPMPLQVFPAAAVITNFVSFLLALPIVAATFIWSGIELHWGMLAVIPLMLLLYLFTYSLSFVLACLFVMFRDLKHIFGIFVGLWMYCTPVLYSAEMVPANYQWVLWINPLSGFFVGVRDVLLLNRPTDPVLFYSFAGWTVAFFILANWMRMAVGPRLVERL